MNEQGWLECADPKAMLMFLRGRASSRKILLFGCACCRRVWQHLRDIRSRQAVEATERFAEGQDTEDMLGNANSAAINAYRETDPELSDLPNYSHIACLAAGAAYSVSQAHFSMKWGAYEPEMPAVQAASLVHCSGAKNPIDYSDRKAIEAAQAPERAVQANLLRDLFTNRMALPPEIPSFPVIFAWGTPSLRCQPLTALRPALTSPDSPNSCS